MRAKLLIWVVLAAALVALPAGALASSAGRTINSTTFPDSTGEDPNGPDITSVVVTNDDAGNITFQINISNRPALTADMFLLVFLDTDQNSATGDPQSLGAEYVIELDPGSVTLFQWNGTEFVAPPSQVSLTYSYQPTGATIRISVAELGKPKAFKFGTLVVSGVTLDAAGNADFSNAHADLAPDAGHGFFTYQVLTRLILRVTNYTTAPKPAKAGRPFSASLVATRNDTGEPVISGTVTCVATIAFKRIPAVTHILTNGVANCAWRLPATAKGKTLRGSITLTVEGVKVTRTFSARIT
jgi:hypothetical protein